MRAAGLVVCVSSVMLLALQGPPLDHQHGALCEEQHGNHHETPSAPNGDHAPPSSSSGTAGMSQQAEEVGGAVPDPHSVRQHIKALRLNDIKLQILSKLRLRSAPNISRRAVQQLLPRAPPLQRLLDQYQHQGALGASPPGSAAGDAPPPPYRRPPPPQGGGATGGGGAETAYRHDRDRMQDAAAAGAATEEEEEEDEHAFAETIMMMATQPSWVHLGLPPEQVPACCLFSFRQKHLQVSRVVRAQLWVHLRASQQDGNVSLQISRLMPVTSDGSRQQSRVRIRFVEVAVTAGSGSWQSIDVKQLLSGWLRKPNTNHGIDINAYDERGTDLAVTSTLPGEEGLQPFLEVKISDSPRRSRRDSGLDCDENSPESRCCRYPLMVDFEDFGWDWIIAPKRYKANYCIGECEYLHLEKYPHTHLVNKATPRGTAGPCCTPKKVSPINMLYFNDKEEIVYGKIPSMVVDRCGCS